MLPVVASLVVFVLVWQLVVFVDGLPLVHPARAVHRRRAVCPGLGRRDDVAPHPRPPWSRSCSGSFSERRSGWSPASCLARSRLAERLLSPYLVAAQATPVLALAPLIVLWFGSGLPSKLVICTLIVFFPVAVATMVGIRSVDPRLLEMTRSFRATGWQTDQPRRGSGRAAGDPRRLSRRDHSGGHRRHRRRVDGGREWARRPDQHRPRLPVRHPAHVLGPPDPRPGRGVALSRHGPHRAPSGRRAMSRVPLLRRSARP